MNRKITDTRQEVLTLEIEVTVRKDWTPLTSQNFRLEAPLHIIGRTDLGPATSATINQVLTDTVAIITDEIRASAADNGRDD